MDRRKFLQNAGGVGTVVAIGGGLWARHAFASHHLQQSLVTEVSPVLTNKAHAEFQVVPVKGREEIRQWFHGKCLNVEPFVDEVCSDRFRQKLHACPSDDDKHRLLMVSFCGKVATDAEILNCVHTITEEAGQELDLNWGECCKTIAEKWNVHISAHSQAIEMNEFLGRIDRLLQAHFKESLQLAKVGARHPAFGETVGNIGRSALSLFPMTNIRRDDAAGQFEGNPVALFLALPTFVCLALEHLCEYIIGLFSEPRSDLQRSISARLGLLGNRVGDEFASEIRNQLGILHGWQERSLTDAAQHYAESVIGWL